MVYYEYNSAVVLFAYFFLPRSGLAGCEDQIRLLGGCVGGLDHVDEDLARGGRVGMVVSCGDGGQRDAGVDHRGVLVWRRLWIEMSDRSFALSKSRNQHPRVSGWIGSSLS